jgi:exodeoxyribonuclease-3
MKIATWNVNGIRARQGQLLAWLDAERPDVVCLQEIKATLDQLPFDLRELEHYWVGWHGGKGYSGVALLVAKALAPLPPAFSHPPFDVESRVIATAVDLGGGPVLTASCYVPNGGKDYAAKLRFLEAMDAWAAEVLASGQPLLVCGDLNVARSDMDIHPKERKANQVGARADERAIFERLLGRGLIDVGRTLHPDDDAFFTWWAPWRNLRQRNIGWRIDYVLASTALAARAESCAVRREIGTSDHGPLVATLRP